MVAGVGIDWDGPKDFIAWFLGSYGLIGLGVLTLAICLVLLFRRPWWYKGNGGGKGP